MASRGRWRASRAAQSCPARTPSPSAEAPLPPRGRLLREAPASFLVPKSRHQKPPPGAMASPPGSPEDADKLRGSREGRQGREDDAPEQKRLRLGLRAGSEPQDGATAPLPTRDELATHTGGEGRGDPLSLSPSLVESQVLASPAAGQVEETAQRPHESGTYSFPDQAQHSDIKANCSNCSETEDRKVSPYSLYFWFQPQ
ncbi:uncharacterized protein LOC143274513 [Peromyscus maniculatus bairdii]|uniref:uncharacterized protein LOC143274513 n=1 Tax=Peromyscus maniculatus bairdii TaxID=230844 RepID=UPI003FD18AB8